MKNHGTFSMILRFHKERRTNWYDLQRFIITKDSNCIYDLSPMLLQRLRNYLVVYFYHANKERRELRKS